LFEQNSCAALLLLERFDCVGDRLLQNVIAQDHADLVTVREVLGQRQRVGDAAFTFLIGVIQIFQSEFLAVRQDWSL
jgi:hypothetical protein